jgi:hypothetical protein
MGNCARSKGRNELVGGGQVAALSPCPSELGTHGAVDLPRSAAGLAERSGLQRFRGAGSFVTTLATVYGSRCDPSSPQIAASIEMVWNEAHEHGDAGALEKLWADDMEVAVPKMPVMTKADVLKFARSGRMKFLSYRTSDIRVRVYDNAAVVAGRLQRTRSMNGQEISDDWRFTKTYVRETGQWRVVSFHASEAAQP